MNKYRPLLNRFTHITPIDNSYYTYSIQYNYMNQSPLPIQLLYDVITLLQVCDGISVTDLIITHLENDYNDCI